MTSLVRRQSILIILEATSSSCSCLLDISVIIVSSPVMPRPASNVSSRWGRHRSLLCEVIIFLKFYFFTAPPLAQCAFLPIIHSGVQDQTSWKNTMWHFYLFPSIFLPMLIVKWGLLTHPIGYKVLILGRKKNNSGNCIFFQILVLFQCLHFNTFKTTVKGFPV